MFSKFQSRRQKRRGSSEDPAAPFIATRRDAGASSELIDFALVDATVNEWMAEAEKQQANRSRADRDIEARRLISEPGSTAAHSGSLSPTGTGTHRAVRSTPDTASTPVPKRSTSKQRRSPQTSAQGTKKLDRVLSAAIAEHVITEDTLKQCMNVHGLAGYPTWRMVSEWLPDHTHALQRQAATVYGFRPVLICQMSTLVLADLLTMRLPQHLWRPMMELGLIPVVEHGTSPNPSQRVLCVAADPSNREIRAFLDDIKSFSPELAYADAHHIESMMALLAQHVPTIGAEIYTTRPVMRRIDSHHTGGKAA